MNKVYAAKDGNGPAVVFDVAQLPKMQIFLPVIRCLESRYGIRSVVLSNSEINGHRPSNMRAFSDWGVECIQVLPIVPSSSFGDRDWRLYMTWLKRNAGRFLEHCSARVLVTPNDRTYPNHFFIDAASAMGIPSVLVQESLRKDDLLVMGLKEKARRKLNKTLFGIDSRLKKYGQGRCTKITAWGETSRDYYLRVGVPPERVVITGNPALDEIQTTDWGKSSTDVARRLEIDPHEIVITFLPNRLNKSGFLTDDELRSRVRWFLREFRSVTQLSGAHLFKLIIKLKADNIDEQAFYEACAMEEDMHSSVEITCDIPLYPLLHRSDAAIMFSSTAGLEAALFGKPVAMLDVGKELDNWGFVDQGVAVRIATTQDLRDYLAYTTSGEKKEQLGKSCRTNAERFVSYLGHATDNVARVIAEQFEATPPN